MASKLEGNNSNNAASNNNATNGRGSLLNSMRTGVMSRGGAGDLLGNYLRVVRSIIERQANPVVSSMRVTAVEGGSAGVAMSSLVITHQEADKTWMYLYLLEGTNAGLGSRELKSNGFNTGGYQQINMPYVAGDLYKASYVQKVIENVAPIIGVDKTTIVDCGCTVLYKEMNPSPKDNEAELNEFVGAVWAGVNAIAFRINLTNPNREEWTVSDLNGQRVNASLKFMNSAIIDEVGMPKRAGYEILTYGAVHGNEDVALSSATPLTQVTGYVDLLQLTEQAAQEAWMAQMQSRGAFGAMSMMQGGTPVVPRFAARVVCTYAQSNTDVMSLGILMYALFTNAILMNNQALWRQQFNNRYNDAMHSLAGLSLELGAQVDPTDAQFSLSQFLTANVVQMPIFTMHVGTTGPSAHLWTLLVTACGTGVEATRAKELILATINKATNGNFGQMFPSTEAIGFVEERIVPAGYFNLVGNGTGVAADSKSAQDIRSIDKLAVGNLTSDLVTIQNFEDARNPEMHTPKEKRFIDELAIISEVLGGRYRLTGRDMAVTLNPKFIIAGYNAFDSAMGGIRLENSHEQLDQEVRGASGYTAYMVSGTQLNRPGNQFAGTQNSMFNTTLRNAFNGF